MVVQTPLGKTHQYSKKSDVKGRHWACCRHRVGVNEDTIVHSPAENTDLVINRSNEINPSYREILGRTQDISFNGYLDAENGK